MNTDIKPASVDSPEFRELLIRYGETVNFGSGYSEEMAIAALVAHISAWSDERCNEAINQLASSGAVSTSVVPGLTDEQIRAEFEAWFSSEGAYPRAVERHGDDYKLMAASSAWRTWQVAAKRLATPVAGWVSVEDEQLMNFYGVSTLADLVRAQERHIAKLQAKLPPSQERPFTCVREG